MKKVSKSVIYVSKNLHKGKIKGKNKKETKKIKAICTHHRLKKKSGKLVPAVFYKEVDGVQKAICPLCGAEFSTELFTKKEVKERFKDSIEVLDQAAYAAEAVGAGTNITDFISSTKAQLKSSKKPVNKVLKIASSVNRVGKKKNKKRNGERGSSAYGSWENIHR